MKLPDANVLLHAVNAQGADHQLAKAWLDDALSGRDRIGFAWVVLLTFVRISTRPALFEHPLTLDEALGVVDGWLGNGHAVVVNPTTSHADELGRLLRAAGTAGNLTNDAHLAALAIEHRATVVTFDADFDRFPGLRWERPVLPDR